MVALPNHPQEAMGERANALSNIGNCLLEPVTAGDSLVATRLGTR